MPLNKNIGYKMEFVFLEEFSISPIYTAKEPVYPTKSYVVLNGTKIRTIIDGIVLEKCVRIYDYYLVFMTYDCPFEEGLTVSLLKQNGKLLEKLDVFAPYCTDDFSDLELYPPNIVTFDFLYKGLWKIEVFSSPRKFSILERLGSIFGRSYKVGAYWKVNLDLNIETPSSSFRLKKLIMILLCSVGLLYLFGYF